MDELPVLPEQETRESPDHIAPRVCVGPPPVDLGQGHLRVRQVRAPKGLHEAPPEVGQEQEELDAVEVHVNCRLFAVLRRPHRTVVPGTAATRRQSDPSVGGLLPDVTGVSHPVRTTGHGDRKTVGRSLQGWTGTPECLPLFLSSGTSGVSGAVECCRRGPSFGPAITF